MQRNGFGQTVTHHLSSKEKTNDEAKPLVQGDVVGVLAVKNGPAGGHERGEYKEAKHQHPIEGSVAAAGVREGRRLSDAENKDRYP